jgi:hypothetical protein
MIGADGGIRTLMNLHSLRPERSASANSATSAKSLSELIDYCQIEDFQAGIFKKIVLFIKLSFL